MAMEVAHSKEGARSVVVDPSKCPPHELLELS